MELGGILGLSWAGVKSSLRTVVFCKLQLKPFLPFVHVDHLQDTDGSIGPRTIDQVDELLNELASKSAYSHKSIRSQYYKNRAGTRAAIIRTLFRPLCPHDASVLTQIILKDLRPLLYPLTEFHYTAALTHFNTASVKMLTLQHAMTAWDPSGNFLRFYRVRACLDEAAAFAGQSTHIKSEILPKLASPIAVRASLLCIMKKKKKELRTRFQNQRKD